jgi:hypothetical protein
MALFLAIVGAFVGAIVGTVAGIAFAYGWLALTDPRCFGAACGNIMLAFSLPLGAALGAIAGAGGLSSIVARRRAKSPGRPPQAGGAS